MSSRASTIISRISSTRSIIKTAPPYDHFSLVAFFCVPVRGLGRFLDDPFPSPGQGREGRNALNGKASYSYSIMGTSCVQEVNFRMYLFTGRGVEIPQEKNSSLQGEIQKLSLSSRLEVPLYTLGRTQLELTVGVGSPYGNTPLWRYPPAGTTLSCPRYRGSSWALTAASIPCWGKSPAR